MFALLASIYWTFHVFQVILFCDFWQENHSLGAILGIKHQTELVVSG